jgi:hypothetical protein
MSIFEFFLTVGLVTIAIVLATLRSEFKERVTFLRERLEILERRIRELESSRAAAPSKPVPSEELDSLQPPKGEPSAPVVKQPPAVPPAVQIPSLAPRREVPIPVAPAPPPPPARPINPAPAQPIAESPRASLEEKLGANWLNKLGIVILVFGIAFFLVYQLGHLGPAGKVAVGYAVGIFLLVGGIFFERRNRYRVFARAGIGGGWALIYFTTYAMQHVAATKVIDSEVLDLCLMLAAAAGMVLHSLRYKSQAVTSIAFLLAFATVAISNVTTFTMVASAILALGLVIVASFEGWYVLELFGLLAVYLNHFYWLNGILEPLGGPGHAFPQFTASAGLLFLYWLIFRVAYVIRRPTNSTQEGLSSVTAVLNSLGVLSLLKYQSIHPEWAFWGLLVLGVAEMILVLVVMGRRRVPFIVLSTIAATLLVAAIPFRYSGMGWSILWIAEAEALVIAGVLVPEKVFRRLGVLGGFVVAAKLFLVDAHALIFDRYSGTLSQPPHRTAIPFLCAAVFSWLNAIVIPRRWPQMAAEEEDNYGLRFTSFTAAALAAVGLWILFPDNQTAIAWAILFSALAFFSGKLSSRDIAAQSDLLAAIAIARCIIVNLQSTAHWGDISQRAASVALVGALLYLCSRRRTESPGIPRNAIPIAYTLAGTALLSLLAWYELKPVNVVLAWGFLGLALFEIGRSDAAYLALQGHALMLASFVRLFFVNFDYGGSSFWHSPRMYTTLPLAVAFYWVHERQRRAEAAAHPERIAGALADWYGTAVIAALIYLEASANWVLMGWCVLALALMALAWLMKRRLILAQAQVMALAALGRGLVYNLWGPRAPAASFWESRMFCVGAAAGVLFLSLPFAFSWRRRMREMTTDPGDLSSDFSVVLNRPEQLFFFAPLSLFTALLTVELNRGMITVSWSAVGVGIFLFAIVVGERSFRLAGLGLLLLAVGKILVVDVWDLRPTDRYITLIVVGAALVLVSFIYTKYREVIQKFL